MGQIKNIKLHIVTDIKEHLTTFDTKMSIPYESDENSDDDQPDEYPNPHKYEDEDDSNKDDDDDDDDEDEESDDDEEVARGQLSDISFGELQKLKEKVGLKKYNEAVFGKKTQVIEPL